MKRGFKNGCLSYQKAVSEVKVQGIQIDRHRQNTGSYLAKLTKEGMIKTRNQNLLPQLKEGMALLSVLANFEGDIEFSISSFLQIDIGCLSLICAVIRCKLLRIAQGSNRISSFKMRNLDLKTDCMRRLHSTNSFLYLCCQKKLRSSKLCIQY